MKICVIGCHHRAAGRDKPMSTNKPVIKVGMTISEITSLLGDPTDKLSMSQLHGMAQRSVVLRTPGAKEQKDTEYWLFIHPAGEYRLVIEDGQVVRIDGHP